MNNPSNFVVTDRYHWQLARLSWGAIVAGCLVALSVHLLLSMLGIGLGVRLVNPFTDENPLLSFTAAAGIAWTASALISLWLGGWVAGRTCGHGYGNIGGLHGVVVWSVATVVSATAIVTGGGLLAGSAVNFVTHAASGAASGLASNLPASDISRSLATTSQTLSSFLDEAVTLPPNAASAADTMPAFSYPRARREVGAAIVRYYSDRTEKNRATLVQVLMDNTGRSQKEAAAIVVQWDQSFNRLQADLKVAADRGRHALVKIGAWTFLAFAIGAFAAAWGGFRGARRAANFYLTHPTAEVEVSAASFTKEISR